MRIPSFFAFMVKGMSGRSVRVALLALVSMAIVALGACVDDASEPETPEGDVAAEAAAAGEAAGGTQCPTVMTDETDPAVARALAGATWEPIGEPTLDRVDGKKVSRAYFQVTTADGELKDTVTVECTSTCSGAWGCHGQGCDASQSGCSFFSCSGIGCTTNVCSKKSIFTPSTTLEP